LESGPISYEGRERDEKYKNAGIKEPFFTAVRPRRTSGELPAFMLLNSIPLEENDQRPLLCNGYVTAK
jgi:hypothetical protein